MQIKQTKNVKTTNKQTTTQTNNKKEGKKEQKGKNALQNTIKMESISLKINPCP